MTYRISFLKRSILALFLIGTTSAAIADVPTAPQFESGDRVCFIGDSITDIGRYHAYLQLFYATRFPDRKILYFPAGHSGGTAGDCMQRLNWDILARNPNIATVNFGMNDMGGKFGTTNSSTEEVEKIIQDKITEIQPRYEKLLDALAASDVRLILIGPSIFDDNVQIGDTPPLHSHREHALAMWTKRIQQIAERRKAGFVDLGTKMSEVNARMQAVDPKATIVGQDRVHPGEPGNLVMAYSILKAQGVDPYVAKISLDSAKAAPDDLINCTVENIERKDSGMSFECLEAALPFPTPYRAEKALELIPFTDELNREILVVKNLAAGKYDVRIDDAVVGQYAASELSAGVNLALNPKTPQYKQSQKVLQSNEERHKLENQLRYLPYLRHNRESLKDFDWNDSVAVDKYLQGEVARLKPYDYYRHIAEAYLKVVSGKADIIKRQVEELKDKMLKDRVPKAHKFALIHVD